MSAKAKFKCTHEENRRKVCATCGRKIIFGKSSVSKFLITENINNLIKLHISAKFNKSDCKLPVSICNT
jgi:hypothetical protein